MCVCFPLVSDALRNGIRFQSELGAAFLKVLGQMHASDNKSHSPKALHLWILFALYSVSQHKKSVEAMFRKQIAA